MIIGLAGYARSGKNSVGEILVKHHGFEQRAFADKIRETLIALDPILFPTVGIKGQPSGYRMSMEDLTFEDLKNDPETGAEIRRLMQRMGTEVGRNIFGETFWIDQCLPVISTSNDEKTYYKYRMPSIVVTDVRFLNETQRIRELGGIIWWIDRPGFGPVNDHVSDNSLTAENCDVTIHNHGTLELLTESVNYQIRQS